MVGNTGRKCSSQGINVIGGGSQCMGNLYKALLSQKSRKFDAKIQLIVPKSTCVHNMWDWIYLGAGIELEIIVGCLIGGATTSGGRGTIAGAVIGTVFMALIRNSFVLYELDPEWRTMVLGGVLVGAVIWDAVIR